MQSAIVAYHLAVEHSVIVVRCVLIMGLQLYIEVEIETSRHNEVSWGAWLLSVSICCVACAICKRFR